MQPAASTPSLKWAPGNLVWRAHVELLGRGRAPTSMPAGAVTAAERCAGVAVAPLPRILHRGQLGAAATSPGSSTLAATNLQQSQVLLSNHAFAVRRAVDLALYPLATVACAPAARQVPWRLRRLHCQALFCRGWCCSRHIRGSESATSDAARATFAAAESAVGPGQQAANGT